MATVLPHAPPAKVVPNLALKVPAATVPTKVGPAVAAPQTATPKLNFQTLLDQLAQAVKGPSEGSDKAKAIKGKTEATLDKPREVKKTDVKDAKDHKAESSEAAIAVATPVALKLEAAVKAKSADTELVQASLDKAKTTLKDRRTGADLAVPAPVTAAAAEVARSQAQANAPKSERTEEKQRVFVVDRRTETKEKEKLKLPGAEAAAQQPVTTAELAVQGKPQDPKAASSEVTASFQAVGGKPKDTFDLKPQAAAPSPRDALTFQQYLVDRGYGQLVDQARIVLKDQNAGEIRMTLYPETLGKVKVSLNLSDNSLAGQIYVENQTVKEVFQSNMDGLLQAFRDGGWNDLSLEVSVGNGNAQSQAKDGQPQQAPQARDYGRQVTQTMGEGRADRIGSWSDRQVNLTA